MLLRIHSIPADDVEVLVEDGVVTLSGRIDTDELADSVVACAECVPGVVAVQGRLGRMARA